MPRRTDVDVGRAYLVGAGPGDPGLITLRGVEVLARADVVLYDYLSSEALLKHAAAGAERVCLGRHGVGKLWTQSDINARIVADARAGKTVVRLKGGDPGVFGRLAEEVEACSAAGVPFEVVPGVTTAVAAGAYAGLTITDRDRSSCVALVTGHERPGKDETDSLDFSALAGFPGTIVVYMAVTNAPSWSRRLVEGGKPAATPVCLVRRCSLPDQSTIECTLGELAEVLAPGRVRPPLVAIIGEVARRTAAIDWFSARPLFGKTVLVTRPREQATAMMDRLSELGARVLVQPAIRIEPPNDWGPVDAAIDRLGEYDGVVFSSRNGVDAFLRRIEDRGLDARRFGGTRIAAIGPATVAALGEWNLRADLAPAEYRAEALAEALAPEAAGRRFLLVRASRGREVLAETLVGSGAGVDQVVAYRSLDVDEADAEVVEALHAGRIDWVTATSSAIARSLARLFGDDLRSTRLAAISPLTGGVLAELGHPAAAVAKDYTADGLIDAILSAEAVAS